MSTKSDLKPADLFSVASNHEFAAIIDIDDVLADFPDAFLRYLMEKTDKPWALKYGQYGLEDAVMRHFGDEVGHLLISEFYEDRQKRYLANLKPIPGSIEYIKYLSNQGYNLHFLTGRPAKMFPHIVEDTSTWLAKQGIRYNRITFTRKKGDYVKEAYRGCRDSIFAIEDNLDFAKQLSPYCSKVYLRNRHYNWPPGPGEGNIRRFWEFEELY